MKRIKKILAVALFDLLALSPGQAVTAATNTESTQLSSTTSRRQPHNLPVYTLGAGMMKETIVGPDNRLKNLSTTAYPYSSVAYLIVHFPKLAAGWYVQGTGTLIGAETVLTAGHVLYDKAYGGWATSVEVVPGNNGTSEPFGSVTSKRFFVPDNYTKKEDAVDDYGVIKLPSLIGTKTGTLGLATGAYVGEQVTLAGYSGDLNGKLGVAKGPISSLWMPQLAQYKLDSTPGSSGSGLFSSKDQIVVVHTSGGTGYNQGVVITPTVFNTILNWEYSLTSASVNTMGYVNKSGWGIYSSLRMFKKVATSKYATRYRISRAYLAPNGGTYYSLYTASNRFVGWVNKAAVTLVKPTTVARTMRVASRSYTRWGSLFYTSKKGTTAAYYNHYVYVATKYYNGSGTYYSLYTRHGGTWLGFVRASALR